MVDVFCDVIANANVDNFHWAFNNSAGFFHVPPNRTRTVNGTRSKLTLRNYATWNNKDYGTFTCEATNKFGKQLHPCVFHIILAGKYLDLLCQFFPFNNMMSNHHVTFQFRVAAVQKIKRLSY